jgi:hypothetical protein
MMSARDCSHGARGSSRTSHHVPVPAPNQHHSCCMQQQGVVCGVEGNAAWASSAGEDLASLSIF